MYLTLLNLTKVSRWNREAKEKVLLTLYLYGIILNEGKFLPRNKYWQAYINIQYLNRHSVTLYFAQ